MSSKTFEDMIWHARDCDTDGMMRYPRDSKTWKDFDLNHPDFAADPRNIRLGLASDGFNPFGAMSTNYSIWPVVLIPYNTPPWKCMKQTNFILSTVIPGPRMIGNEIDICLQPLIEELKELWEKGVALLWTISDFPGLATLSGWNTHWIGLSLL